MRPGVKFHDGSPLTAHDVAFSLKILKDKGHPIAQQLLRDFAGADATDDATVVVRFAPQSRRATCRCSWRRCRSSRVPTIRAARSTRPRSKCRSAAGPTRSGASRPAATSNSNGSRTGGAPIFRSRAGKNNFDFVRYEYYRDRDVAFEGFTGKSYLFREEFTSRIWATRYDFPAIRDGRVKRDVIRDQTPSGAQGWFFNTRRDKFKDKRLREALIYAFDFEWTNKSIMYGSYRADPFRVPEFPHDGDRQARRRRACAARTVPRQGARRGVRRAVRAAGVRRIGPGPRAAAQGERAAAGRPASPSRTASA